MGIVGSPADSGGKLLRGGSRWEADAHERVRAVFPRARGAVSFRGTGIVGDRSRLPEARVTALLADDHVPFLGDSRASGGGGRGCRCCSGGGSGPRSSLLRRNWTTYLWLAATTGAMQSTTLFTFRKTAGGLLAGAVSVVYLDQRISGIPIFPGRAFSEAAGGIGDYGGRRRADCGAGTAALRQAHSRRWKV